MTKHVATVKLSPRQLEALSALSKEGARLRVDRSRYGCGLVGDTFVRNDTLRALEKRGWVTLDSVEYKPERTVRTGFGADAKFVTVVPVKHAFYKITDAGRSVGAPTTGGET